MHEDAALERFRSSVGEPAWHRLADRLAAVNRDIKTLGIRDFEGGAGLLTGYSYGEFYDWDLYFENVYMSYYGISSHCRTNLDAFLDRQVECGFVARTLVQPRWRQHFKPFLAQIALLGSRQDDGFDWLAGRRYERLGKYLDYWFWHQDFDRNGLCVWDSADHSGMDNQDRRAGRLFSMTVEGVDLNCYLVRELEAMAVIADGLGRDGDAAGFAAHASDLAGLINGTFWDEDDGFYYDRNERTGQPVRVRSVAGFVPLWAGIAPKERAEHLVKGHLLDRNEFWRPYPVATWARSEPDYYQEPTHGECNWRGPAWVPTNYMVFHGLVRYGFDEAARELAYRTFEMALSEPRTREFYNAETGGGLGLDPFWGWSALAYCMPLEYELGYDPTDIVRERIVPIARDILKVAF